MLAYLAPRCSWLFPKIDAALHHGGAGTTGASLRGKRSFLICAIHQLKCYDSRYTHHYPPLVWVSREEARMGSTANDTYRDQFFWASRVQKLGVRISIVVACGNPT
jgi:hypothetical protein